MYAEDLKQKQVRPLTGALITLGIVFTLLISSFFVQFAQYVYEIVWPQFVYYGLVVVLVVLAIRRYFTEYIYLIETDRITFGRRIGKREKELLYVPLRDVLWVGPYEGNESKIGDRKVYRFTFMKEPTWSLIECRRQAIILTCTQEYIDRLKKCISNRRTD